MSCVPHQPRSRPSSGGPPPRHFGGICTARKSELFSFVPSLKPEPLKPAPFRHRHEVGGADPKNVSPTRFVVAARRHKEAFSAPESTSTVEMRIAAAEKERQRQPKFTEFLTRRVDQFRPAVPPTAKRRQKKRVQQSRPKFRVTTRVVHTHFDPVAAAHCEKVLEEKKYAVQRQQEKTKLLKDEIVEQQRRELVAKHYNHLLSTTIAKSSALKGLHTRKGLRFLQQEIDEAVKKPVYKKEMSGGGGKVAHSHVCPSCGNRFVFM